ncbi:MAG: DUF1572 domain-containing protein [Chitinophagales bacterium]
MKAIISLTNRLKEVLTEGKWVTGTNFKEQIIDMDWKDAATSIDGLNSVAQLTFHIHYYIAGVSQVFEGGPLDIRDKYSFAAPPITSEKDWLDLVNQFCLDAEKFIQLVEEMPDEKLSEFFFDEKYGTYQRNINLMIEHCYYHLGQVLIIKKLVGRRE